MIEQMKGRLGEVTAGFTMVQKATMAAVFAAVVGGLWFFSSWAATTDMAPLYADLETADAAAVVDELDAMGVPYELADQGSTVMVPRDRVYELRLDLSTAGLPAGGSQGYALLDDQGITSTRFQQEVAYQRALEGELAATIRSIEAVEGASVHLVIPQDDLFAGDDVHASASVLVETDATLAAEQVEAIVNLVSGSVKGLTPDAVTVADQTGLVLAAPGQDAFSRAGLGGASNQTHRAEQELQAEIQSMLTAVAGPGNAIVTIGLQMDWDATSSVSEVHTPAAVPEGADPLLSSERITTESYTTGATGDGGVLGGGQDPVNGSAGSTFNSSDESRDFVFDTEVVTTENQGGTVERVNVAVLLDEESVTQAQMTEIEGLVESAIGIDPERGDTLAVSRLAFDSTIEEALAAGLESGGGVAGVAEAGGGIVGTLILVIFVLAIVAIAGVQLWRGRPRSEEIEELDLVTLTNSLTAGAARPVLPVTASAVAPSRSSARSDAGDAEPLTPEDELRDLVDQQPDEVARLLRTWLSDRRAVAR